LWLTDQAPEIDPFFINQLQFPSLRSIQSMSCSWGASPSLVLFPPLQHLAIRINRHSTWLEVVKNCSATLKSLRLVGYLQWTDRVTIMFPQLESLSLHDWSERSTAMEWSIKMVTPALISYTEFASPRLRHSDVKSVIYLGSNHIPDLAPYTSLRILVLSASYPSMYVLSASKLVEQLTQDINTCPALQRTEFYLSRFGKEDPEIEKGIIEKIRAVRPGVGVVFTTGITPMPRSIEESLVSVLGSSLLTS
jgi:hypothetical protein